MEHPLQVEEFSPADALRVALSLPDAAPLPPLPDIPASEVLFLRPSDPQYRNFLPAANSRAQLSPALRAVCRNERAVAAMIDWVVSNNFTFAVRCGGSLLRRLIAIERRGDRPPGDGRYRRRRPQAWSRSAGHRCSTSIRRWRPRAWRCRPEAVRPSASPAISWAAGTDCWRGRTA